MGLPLPPLTKILVYKALYSFLDCKKSKVILAALAALSLVAICWTQNAHAKPLESKISCRKALPAPEWAQRGVMYSIFPRNFSEKGDLGGVAEKVDELKNLGVGILWLLPIHPIGREKRKGTLGSPYSIQNYHEIDPAYGTKEDLKNLVKKVHSTGLKIILDAVLNHTAWDNVLMEQHPEFYRRDETGQVIPPLPEWKDVAALDYSNPELRSFMIGMLQEQLREYDLDGFRFDASDFVPLDFWEEVREKLHEVKEDILLLGEGEKPEALCEAFDLDYDWRFKKALDAILIDGAPATQTIQRVLREEEELFPPGSLHLRFSDNHDERRAIARYGEKGALAASALLFALDGVPLIYNGMEVGDTTESRDPALFEKMPIFWKSEVIRPDFKPCYRKLIAFRKAHPALWKGKTSWLKNSCEDRVLTFIRTFEEDSIFVAINFSNQPIEGKIDGKGSLTLDAWEVRFLNAPESDVAFLEEELSNY